MSPKFCSLALDETELEEQYTDLIGEKCYEPELTVLVKRHVENSSSDHIVRVTGRVNVSF